MGKYIKYYDTHSEYDGEKDYLDLPNVSWCEQEEDVHYGPEIDYSNDYLTFTIVEDGTLCWKTTGGGISFKINYSIDNGATWTEISPSDTPFLNVVQGQKILFKGNNSAYYFYYDSRDQDGNYFNGTASFNISGNIMSLIGGDNFINTTTFNYDLYHHGLEDLFKGCNIINAKNLILPVMTLKSYCYAGMFSGCTSLKTAPELPATTLEINCYGGMFAGCTSLTRAPKLPATTLEDSCYYNMFGGCTSLTTAPVLSATTLVKNCYAYMFYNCTSLNYIKAMFTTEPSSTYTYYWVNGVASTGKFIKNSAATWATTGVNGIPTGWTVKTASA